MKIHSVFSVILFLLFSSAIQAQSVEYSVAFSEPQAHYADVTVKISDWKGGDLNITMPVWTPGSYLIREFSRLAEDVKAADDKGNFLSINKTRKNSWKIVNAKTGNISVSYRIYAFELTVRTSFIDVDHASLNGASIFMYVEGLENKSCTIDIKPYKDWKTISVVLDRVNENNPWKVKAENYDALVDAPFEIGNHLVLSFTAVNIPHEIAVIGEGNFDAERLKKDFAKIVEEATSVFGTNPCKHYLFIIQNVEKGGGGLEHKNSTTILNPRWSYSSQTTYSGFLSTVAHEYFHLWNVKRLHPKALDTFDYNQEVYTNMLYVAEGFTAYYDDIILKRCGIYSVESYLDALVGGFNTIDNTAGNKSISLADASYDAWLRYYRPYENGLNTNISYYTKGHIIAALIDFEIRGNSNGVKSLDELMKSMYKKYYEQLNRGYTDREFMDAVSDFCGKNMDSFFNKYVYSTDSIPYSDFLSKIGLKLTNLNAGQTISWFGANTSNTSGKMLVTGIERNSPAWNYGINVNDEIIAFDQYRITDDVAKFVAMKKPGDKSIITVSRNGFIKNIELIFSKAPTAKYALAPDENASEDAKARYKKWLKL